MTDDGRVSDFVLRERILSGGLARSKNMTSLTNKNAVVIGGSSGVGKATVKALLAEGARVTAVGRDAEKLRALEAETERRAATLTGDATDPELIARLFRDVRPDLVVLAAGIKPTMGFVHELEWDDFSEAWNQDAKAAFLVVKQALSQPLAPGSTVVLVSSGAAIEGSPLSGGYAGAKRMQWLLAGYAQKAAEAKNLGIRTLAVLPKQLIVGTAIGAGAAARYAEMTGSTPEQYMKRWPHPLDVEKVAQAILSGLKGEVPNDVKAIAVTGSGIEQLK
jgi:NAD(P)-dependent dehydrogenase (short-subunit alcohol dehydrogenase family)